MSWSFILASDWNPEQIEAFSRCPSVTHDTLACPHYLLDLSFSRGRNLPLPLKAGFLNFSSNFPFPLIQFLHITIIHSPSNLSFFVQRNSEEKQKAFVHKYCTFSYPFHLLLSTLIQMLPLPWAPGHESQWSLSILLFLELVFVLTMLTISFFLKHSHISIKYDVFLPLLFLLPLSFGWYTLSLNTGLVLLHSSPSSGSKPSDFLISPLFLFFLKQPICLSDLKYDYRWMSLKRLSTWIPLLDSSPCSQLFTGYLHLDGTQRLQIQMSKTIVPPRVNTCCQEPCNFIFNRHSLQKIG